MHFQLLKIVALYLEYPCDPENANQQEDKKSKNLSNYLEFPTTIDEVSSFQVPNVKCDKDKQHQGAEMLYIDSPSTLLVV